jgi:hypothetical protein
MKSIWVELTDRGVTTVEIDADSAGSHEETVAIWGAASFEIQALDRVIKDEVVKQKTANTK